MNPITTLNDASPKSLPQLAGGNGPADSFWHERPPFRALQAVQHILVPVDFSENSHAALRYALRLAKEFGARLTLLHIVEAAPLPMDYGFYDLPAEARAEMAGKQ